MCKRFISLNPCRRRSFGAEGEGAITLAPVFDMILADGLPLVRGRHSLRVRVCWIKRIKAVTQEMYFGYLDMGSVELGLVAVISKSDVPRCPVGSIYIISVWIYS
jgi:hypothetical protein